MTPTTNRAEVGGTGGKEEEMAGDAEVRRFAEGLDTPPVLRRAALAKELLEESGELPLRRLLPRSAWKRCSCGVAPELQLLARGPS